MRYGRCAVSSLMASWRTLLLSRRRRPAKASATIAQARREATVAGLIVDVRKRGNRVSVVLDDDTARMEVSLFSEAFQEFRHLLVKDEIVVVSGRLALRRFHGGWTVNVKNVLHIDRVIESRAKSMVLSLAPNGQVRACWCNCTICCCRIEKAAVMYRCAISATARRHACHWGQSGRFGRVANCAIS